MAFGFSYSFTLPTIPDRDILDSFMDHNYMEADHIETHGSPRYSMSHLDGDNGLFGDERAVIKVFIFGSIISIAPRSSGGHRVRLTNRLVTVFALLISSAILIITVLIGNDISGILSGLCFSALVYFISGMIIFIAGKVLKARLTQLLKKNT